MSTIKRFATAQDYASAGAPTEGHRVALIKNTGDVMVDGVNVPTLHPSAGDAVYIYDGVYYFFKGEALTAPSGRVFNKGYTLNPAALTALGYVYKGVVIDVKGDTVRYFKGDYASLPSYKWLDVCQYAITAISSATLSIKLRMSPDYAVDTTVEVTLTSPTIGSASAEEISAAVAAKASEVGDSKDWWAYLADAQGNKVESNGTQIIIQCDSCVDYRFYNVSATGCTISHVSWGDMPSSDMYMKVNGKSTNYRGLMNFAGAVSYWSTNGRVPTADIAIHGEAGNTDPVKLSEFNSNAYCLAIRSYYGTYEKYLRGEFGIQSPQRHGCFALPNGKKMTDKYGPMMAPTKGGGTKAKYTALNWAYLQEGDSHLWDVEEGTLLMEDDMLAVVNATQTKHGKVTLSNSTYRWFAERGSVYGAWSFSGHYRYLTTDTVSTANQVGAVSLLKINQ